MPSRHCPSAAAATCTRLRNFIVLLLQLILPQLHCLKLLCNSNEHGVMRRRGESSRSKRERTGDFLIFLLYFVQYLVYLRPQTRVLRFSCGCASVCNLLQRRGGDMTVKAIRAAHDVTRNVGGGPR